MNTDNNIVVTATSAAAATAVAVVDTQEKTNPVLEQQTTTNTETNNTTDGDTTVTTSTTSTTTEGVEGVAVVVELTKSQKKKQVRQERWNAVKDLKKAHEREKTKEKRKRKKQSMSSEERLELNRVKMQKKRDPSEIDWWGNIIFDFQHASLMGQREIKSLITQISFAYGNTLRLERPLFMDFCSFTGPVKESFEALQGYINWKVGRHEQSYMDLYKKEELVYLTAESPNIIKELDPTKKYIIGALVDHNRYKGLTYNTALEQGIETAQLPISEFIQLSSRKVLAVNHVFDILLKQTVNNDWKKSFEEVIPSRKVAKEGEEDGEEGEDQSGQDGEEQDSNNINNKEKEIEIESNTNTNNGKDENTTTDSLTTKSIE
ncbi:Putative RNaseIII [Cavenderia fasciculata]|uniref:tRNA (guanine(9)-N(1))-methyltransferase n=1 Tax=Cavenderia fasciculata TaxID=261658 RepID=F4PP99_CACFS|nr:Putative RNaseIII [Cavenderia fasciculata]EGG22212.1 Putative RNaseIII [Cavenderia fasciculata]|eukprot:XP_004360063.1 Putative RNaseIII [Cavenderia fasciculata]